MNRTAGDHTTAGSVIKAKSQPRVRARAGQRWTRSFSRTQFDAAIIVIDNVLVPTNAPAECVDAVLDALSPGTGPWCHALVEGSFLVRPLHEICQDTPEAADHDDGWLG